MESFYYLHFREDDGGGVACAGDPTVDEISKIMDKDIEPFRFVLEGTLAQDYQANDLGWPLMSKRMKDIVSRFSDSEQLHWQHSLLVIGTNEFDFYIPKFMHKYDVLNLEKSKIVSGSIGDVIIKACLAREKLDGLDIFPIPGSEIRLVISSRLKHELEHARLSGLEFSPVPVL